MAEGKITVTCHYRWVDEDPNGQECFVCGDRCYLFSPKRMEIIVQPENYEFETEEVICASCFDAITEEG